MFDPTPYLPTVRRAIFGMAKRLYVLHIAEDMYAGAVANIVEHAHRFNPKKKTTPLAFCLSYARTGALKTMHNVQGGETRPKFVTEIVKKREDGPEPILDFMESAQNDPEQELHLAEQQQALDSVLSDVRARYGADVVETVIKYLMGEFPDRVADKGFLRKCREALLMVQQLLRNKGWDVPFDTSKIPVHAASHRRLTEENIQEIRALREAGWSQRAVALKFGVQQSAINRVAKGFNRNSKWSSTLGTPVVTAQEFARIKAESRASKSTVQGEVHERNDSTGSNGSTGHGVEESEGG